MFGRAGSTTRWTTAGSGAEPPDPPDRAGAADERTGIPAGASRAFGIGSTAAGDKDGDAVGGGVALPGCARRRSPSSGASFWSLAVDGSEVSGAPIPPRARAGEPDTSRGDDCGAGESGNRTSLTGD
ncbi:hypothetical protein [Streptomyces sp. NPDC024089]|uniref:hypothetical protein n=1 Tax=Streptomyces sp. NPDC024089 TaxID=3154328 RepID=UPI0034049AE3